MNEILVTDRGGLHPLIVVDSRRRGLVSFDGREAVLHRHNARYGARAGDVAGYGARVFEELTGIAPKVAVRASYSADRRRRKAHLEACRSHLIDGRCFRCGSAI